jgi:hypothetical protein
MLNDLVEQFIYDEFHCFAKQSTWQQDKQLSMIGQWIHQSSNVF